MNREQLAHVLRAAATVVDDGGIVVVGSQAILGTYDSDDLPEEATMSVEADVAFWDDPDEAKSDRVDGAIGEYSPFHQQFGYYGQGVSVATAVLPAGWRDRVVRFDLADAEPSAAVCIEAHDLVVSKLVAGREKDISFAGALVRERLVDVSTLLDRAATITGPETVRDRVIGHIRRSVQAAEGE